MGSEPPNAHAAMPLQQAGPDRPYGLRTKPLILCRFAKRAVIYWRTADVHAPSGES